MFVHFLSNSLMFDKLNIQGFQRLASIEQSPKSGKSQTPMYYQIRAPHRSFDIPSQQIFSAATESKPQVDYLKPPLSPYDVNYKPTSPELIKCDRPTVNKNVELMVDISLIYMQLKRYKTKQNQARLKQKASVSDYHYMDRKNAQELYSHDLQIQKVRKEQALLLHQLKYVHRNDEIVDKQTLLENLCHQLKKLQEEESSLQKIFKAQNTSLNEIRTRGNLSTLIANTKQELKVLQQKAHQEAQKTQSMRRGIFQLNSNNRLEKENVRSKKQQFRKTNRANQNYRLKRPPNMSEIPQIIKDQNQSSTEKVENIEEQLKKLRLAEQSKRKILESKQRELRELQQVGNQLKKIIKNEVKLSPERPRQVSKSETVEFRIRKGNTYQKHIV